MQCSHVHVYCMYRRNIEYAIYAHLCMYLRYQEHASSPSVTAETWNVLDMSLHINTWIMPMVMVYVAACPQCVTCKCIKIILLWFMFVLVACMFCCVWCVFIELCIYSHPLHGLYTHPTFILTTIHAKSVPMMPQDADAVMLVHAEYVLQQTSSLQVEL